MIVTVLVAADPGFGSGSVPPGPAALANAALASSKTEARAKVLIIFFIFKKLLMDAHLRESFLPEFLENYGTQFLCSTLMTGVTLRWHSTAASD
jgi:hypothetical protein